MGRISLFSGYSTAENRTTNYCLLILKMVYEENPKLLADVLSTVVGDNISDHIGVKFLQQQRKSGSIPDGVILQDGFILYIETKHFNWFHDQQLEQHLDALHQEKPGIKILIALSNFESDELPQFDRIRHLCHQHYRGAIYFATSTFEDMLRALQALPSVSKNLADAILDFRAYLDEQNLLPSWRYTLDVVNCAGYPEEVIDGHVYTCPAAGGSYTHKRCRYFGMYRNKAVEYIAEIKAVVDVEADDAATLLWKNVPSPKEELLQTAIALRQRWWQNDTPARVFILDTPFPTRFVKDSRGGMQFSKKYFDIGHLQADTATELAAALNGTTWSAQQAGDV